MDEGFNRLMSKHGYPQGGQSSGPSEPANDKHATPPEGSSPMYATPPVLPTPMFGTAMQGSTQGVPFQFGFQHMLMQPQWPPGHVRPPYVFQDAGGGSQPISGSRPQGDGDDEVEEVHAVEKSQGRKGKAKAKPRAKAKSKGRRNNSDEERPNAEETVDVLDEEEEESKGRGPKYTAEEDKDLISVWLNTSYDPIEGNDRPAKTFWGKITEDYNIFAAQKNRRLREGRSCENRWCYLNREVARYIGLRRSVYNLNQSGTTEEDKAAHAARLYFQKTNHVWDLDHAWKALKDQHKWRNQAPLSEMSGKRQKSSSGATPRGSSSVGCESGEGQQDPDDDERPIGRRRAKLAASSTNNITNALGKWVGMKDEQFKIKLAQEPELVRIRNEPMRMIAEAKHLDAEAKHMAAQAKRRAQDEELMQKNPMDVQEPYRSWLQFEQAKVLRRLQSKSDPSNDA